MRPVPEHGTAARYGRGCRCKPCKSAATAKAKAWRQANPEAYNRSRARQRARYRKEGGNDFPHGLSGYTVRGCRCEDCSEAMRTDARTRAQSAASTTTPAATRYGHVWTGAELEQVATRNDLTETELALLLGRTARAVKRMRRLVMTDPKWMKAAGVDDA